MQPYGAIAQSDTSLYDLSRRELPTRLGERAQHSVPVLASFEPITLRQVDAVALMNRIDTKYIFGLPQLPRLLEALVDDYWVLEVTGVRLSRYRTLYFDNETLDLYTSHLTGRAKRYKVRSRTYLDSGVSFLEVKRRSNKGRTIKERIKTPTFLTQITPEAGQFVDDVAPYGARPLRATLWNEFSRITLVSKARPERVTLDLRLGFQSRGHHTSLEGVVVAEVKQDRVHRDSAIMTSLRALGIRPSSFSKYCVGIAILFPNEKHNRFKPVLRQADRIMRGDYYV